MPYTDSKNERGCPGFGYDFQKYNIYHIRGYIKHDSNPNHCDEPFTEEELCSLIQIYELSVKRDGTIQAYYTETGDLFGGHAFEISANLKGEIYGTDFVG